MKNTEIRTKYHRAVSCFVVFCLMMTLTVIPIIGAADEVYAYTPVAGTINNGPVWVRKAPVNGDGIVTLSPGTAVTVIDETNGSDGFVWYQIQVLYNGTTITGYTRSDFITLQNAQQPDAGGAASGNMGVVGNTDSGVNVRSGPGTSYSAIASVYKGQVVTIIGEAAGGGRDWYNVTFTIGTKSYTGWICKDYVNVSGTASPGDAGGVPTDDAYVAQLKAAGFPDSYCGALAALHAKYPNWQFVPVQTGLDWNTVIAQESVVGRNLIQSSANDARKSTESTAYNWATNSWYNFDGAGWVSASKEYIAYCMDPRNFLNETYIFQFETLEYAPYQSAAGVSNVLAGTFMAGNYTDTDQQTRSYADTFVAVGQGLAVSPYHLAARCKQEQGTNGTSPLISGKYAGYEGYYNYFNVGAYTTQTASSTVNGLIYAKNQGWNSIYRSIEGGSAVVANNYVKKGQNTIYFEKFNVVYQASLYTHQYMTNVQAAMSEGSSMGKAYTDKNQAFVFRIPVYANMPASAVTFKDSGNPNNWLSALSVSGYNLTPAFGGATTSYMLVVGQEVGAIRVDATAVAKTSQVTGTGNYSLNYGNNTIEVTCISQSGVPRTYTLIVARQQPAAGGNTVTVADGMTLTSPYMFGSVVTGIAPGSSASQIAGNIVADGCTFKIMNAAGEEQKGTVGTGNKIAVYSPDGTLIKQYEVVVYGDINGDGKVSNVDLVLMQKQILGITSQTGAYLEAANTSKDGGVSNKDLVILQKHILGIAQIAQ